MYGSFFNKMGAGETKSGFYESQNALEIEKRAPKRIKPLELMGSTKAPLLAQMWAERAKKINK